MGLVCLAALAAIGPAPAAGQEELFVPHAHLSQAGLRVFAAGATGDAPPLRTIAGDGSGVTFPGGVAVDPCAGELVVTNSDTALGQVSLRVFGWKDTGPVAPRRVIQGPATKLGDPHGVAIAPLHDEVIVANLIGVEPITVYDRLGPGGDQAPVRSLAGANTGLLQPFGVAYDDAHDEIVVASSGNASIRVFQRTQAGDVQPVRFIAGPQTALTPGIRGVAVDPARGVIAVADVTAGAVRIFVRSATGDALPVQSLLGLTKAIGVAFGPQSGELFVTQASDTDRVQVFAPSGGVYAFSRTIGGAQTGLTGPALPAVAPATLPVTSLVAAVLPLSRSAHVGQRTATAFVTIVNAGPAVACQVRIGLGLDPFPATLTFQPTDPTTNQPIGVPGTRVAIPPGASATFVVALTPTAPFDPVDLPFDFAGINTLPVGVIVGVNTLLVSASLADVPDVIALVATVSQDGVVRVPGPAGTAAFSVAASNVGVGDTVTVSADSGAVGLPVAFLVCETDPVTAQCITPLAPTRDLFIGPGGTPTFTVLATAFGDIAFDPALHRVFVRFRGSDGAVRGATGAALTTR